MPPVLIVPGWTNSGPEHWQTLWEGELPDARRVEQRDWDHPVRTEWVAALDSAIRAATHPPILVAHSLGCLAVVHWAVAHSAPVHGALLVAPPDVEHADAPMEIRGFAPIPLERLPFPSIVAASSDDPFASGHRSRSWAAAWGSRLEVIGAVGHMNSSSRLGAWPEGRRLLAHLGA